MNDSSNTRGNSNTDMTLMGFAVGAAVGAGLALLLAPDSGKSTRDRLVSTARGLSKSAGHTLDQARETMVELGSDAKSAIKAGQDSFLHDRATRESRSERAASHADDGAHGHSSTKRTSDGAAR